jgi:glycosyltransferase involved in cell wall biosynthesis
MSADDRPLSAAHRAWRRLPAGPRRALAARAAAVLAPRPDRDPPPPAAPGLLVAGEIGRASGLGEGARLMVAAARALGVPAAAVPCGIVPGGEGAEVAFDGGDPAALPAGAPLVVHVNAPVLPAALLRLGRRALRGRRVVGYWAWELPVVPRAWRTGLPFVHEVWAPSRFTAAALATLVGRPVRVVPHALPVPPPAAPGARAAWGLPADAVVSLVSFSLASSFARKNPLAALAAHEAAFGARPDRILLLKVGKPGHHDADFRTLREAVAGRPNVRLETRTLPPAANAALLAAADIVLSLHRSEGFGLVAAEAMRAGLPVVATDWSGTTDFLDATCAMPVPYRLVPARDARGVFEAPGAVWAEADVAAAAAALRALADDGALRQRLGAAARARAATSFGADTLRPALAALGVRPP